MEDGLAGGGGIADAQDLGAAHGVHLQGDGAGQTGVPDDEAGIGGSDEQGIVHVPHPLGHFAGQQSTGDEAEAPVEPAADGGDKGGHQDGALLVVSQAGERAQAALTGLGRGHGGAEHQHQSHLHGKAQQAPHTGFGGALTAPGPDQVQRALLGAEHRRDEDHDGEDHREQERIGQPAVDHADAAVRKLLEQKIFLPCVFSQSPFL